jgi:hypothetical protein
MMNFRVGNKRPFVEVDTTEAAVAGLLELIKNKIPTNEDLQPTPTYEDLQRSLLPYKKTPTINELLKIFEERPKNEELQNQYKGDELSKVVQKLKRTKRCLELIKKDEKVYIDLKRLLLSPLNEANKVIVSLLIAKLKTRPDEVIVSQLLKNLNNSILARTVIIDRLIENLMDIKIRVLNDMVLVEQRYRLCVAKWELVNHMQTPPKIKQKKILDLLEGKVEIAKKCLGVW